MHNYQRGMHGFDDINARSLVERLLYYVLDYIHPWHFLIDETRHRMLLLQRVHRVEEQEDSNHHLEHYGVVLLSYCDDILRFIHQ